MDFLYVSALSLRSFNGWFGFGWDDMMTHRNQERALLLRKKGQLKVTQYFIVIRYSLFVPYHGFYSGIFTAPNDR
jgi:hypothetical protein